MDLFFETKDDLMMFCKSPGVLIFFFCASIIILFTNKFLIGLSGSIAVITTPVVPSGSFLLSMSSLFKGLTSILRSSIIVEAQKERIKSIDDLKQITKQVLKSNQKTILLAIYNNQNQRRYIGIKLD